MSTPADERPCPFCQEMIKVTAVKCRFCGEFLQDVKVAPTVEPVTGDTEEKSTRVVRAVVPIGRSLWAIASGYLGLAALVPFFLFAFIIFSEARLDLRKTVLMLSSLINSLLGLMAIVTGIAALLSIRANPGTKGVPRAVFGMIVGLVAGIAYPILTQWFIASYVGIE